VAKWRGGIIVKNNGGVNNKPEKEISRERENNGGINENNGSV